MVVWKFPLASSGINRFSVGSDAVIVMVAIDPETRRPAIWIQHDHNGLQIEVRFEVFGTGWYIPDDLEHAGSVIDDGNFIWHVYQHAAVAIGE